jgi:hypothetical protein
MRPAESSWLAARALHVNLHLNTHMTATQVTTELQLWLLALQAAACGGCGCTTMRLVRLVPRRCAGPCAPTRAAQTSRCCQAMKAYLRSWRRQCSSWHARTGGEYAAACRSQSAGALVQPTALLCFEDLAPSCSLIRRVFVSTCSTINSVPPPSRAGRGCPPPKRLAALSAHCCGAGLGTTSRTCCGWCTGRATDDPHQMPLAVAIALSHQDLYMLCCSSAVHGLKIRSYNVGCFCWTQLMFAGL